MNHNQRVQHFIRQCREANPEEFKRVCDKYPILTADQWETVREREINVGLIGLEPTPISPEIAAANNLESAHEKEGD